GGGLGGGGGGGGVDDRDGAVVRVGGEQSRAVGREVEQAVGRAGPRGGGGRQQGEADDQRGGRAEAHSERLAGRGDQGGGAVIRPDGRPARNPGRGARRLYDRTPLGTPRP